MAVTDDSLAGQEPRSLLQLPAELRLEILEMVICTEPISLEYGQLVSPDLAVLAACQQLRSEGTPILTRYLRQAPAIRATVLNFNFVALGDLLQWRIHAPKDVQTPLANLRITMVLGTVDTMPRFHHSPRAAEPLVFFRAIRLQPLFKDALVSWRIHIDDEYCTWTKSDMNELHLQSFMANDIDWMTRIELVRAASSAAKGLPVPENQRLEARRMRLRRKGWLGLLSCFSSLWGW